jgi:hypothetical protein
MLKSNGADPVVGEALKHAIRFRLSRYNAKKIVAEKKEEEDRQDKKRRKLNDSEKKPIVVKRSEVIFHFEDTDEWSSAGIDTGREGIFSPQPQQQNKKKDAPGGEGGGCSITPPVEYLSVKVDESLRQSIDGVDSLVKKFVQTEVVGELLSEFKSYIKLASDRLSMFSVNDATRTLFDKIALYCYLSQTSIVAREEELEAEFNTTLQCWLNDIIKEDDNGVYQIESGINPSVYMQLMKAINAFIDHAGSYSASTFMLVSVLDILLNVKNVNDMMKKNYGFDTTGTLCLILGCQMSRIFSVMQDGGDTVNKEDWMGYKDTVNNVLSSCRDKSLRDLIVISVVQRQREKYLGTLKFFGIKQAAFEIQVCDRCYDTYYGCNQCNCSNDDDVPTVVPNDAKVVDVHKKLVTIVKSSMG